VSSILISLPDNREQHGQLAMDNGFGPVPCLGKADNAEAAKQGNPLRNPERPFGDTPLGEYIGSVRYETDTPANQHSYGSPDASGKIPVVHLQPIEGDTQAWARETFEGMKDMGILIHCRANENTILFPTHGCVRVFQKDMTALIAALSGVASFPVSIQQQEASA
jgi:hypothetical protein